MAGYIYDLAQLIHQLQRRARHDHRPLARRQHRAALRRALSRERRQAGRHRGARRHRRRCWPQRLAKSLPRAHARLDRRAARPLGPPAAPLRHDRGRLQAHAGGEQAPLARAGAPPHRCTASTRTRTAPTAGSSTTTCAPGRPTTCPTPTSRRCGRASPARRCSSTASESWASNPVEDGRARHFRNAEVVTVEGAGHWVHHDRLAEFLALHAAVPGGRLTEGRGALRARRARARPATAPARAGSERSSDQHRWHQREGRPRRSSAHKAAAPTTQDQQRDLVRRKALRAGRARPGRPGPAPRIDQVVVERVGGRQQTGRIRSPAAFSSKAAAERHSATRATARQSAIKACAA